MKDELKKRTKTFAVAIIKMTETLPRRNSTTPVSNQIIRSSTSVGANYRAALRGRSKADFIAKLGIVVEESDETLYWLEIIVESELANKDQIAPLWKEGNELTSIFVKMLKTAKSNRDKM
ncbi:four helix bundle protein [Algoriphagus pacificus]|uniref:Four helix bundle protein n=1 Tax=Algoriphagus pacificus TaxID=2811234 RepID=A0ABS3CLY0_9BACT|nr:four helix bundle protein [Algoriphagus pacificus]MBN7818106.1 four helix bundle protein [Algoriphagus pacificus]